MRELAPGVFQLSGFPPNGINVYVIGDVLVDAATRLAGRRIMRQIAGRNITAHALTHSHPDHQGASHQVCEKLGIPYWVGERDVESAETGNFEQSGHPLNRLIAGAWAGPAIRSRAGCTRATRWPASRFSTCRAIRRVTLPTGASRTGC